MPDPGQCRRRVASFSPMILVVVDVGIQFSRPLNAVNQGNVCKASVLFLSCFEMVISK